MSDSSDPMDCSLPGIFQAKVLEWGAIAFSVRKLYLSLNCKRQHCWVEYSWLAELAGLVSVLFLPFE